jgi:hypothetical protein
MGKEKNEAHVQINDYPYTATVRDLKTFAKHLDSESEKFTLGVFGKITYISDDADKEWVDELNSLIKAKQDELDTQNYKKVKKETKRVYPRITKESDADDIGFKEHKDQYTVGEGGIRIIKETDEDGNEINEYYILDTRNGNEITGFDTLTAARKELRNYLNKCKVFITSEKKYYGDSYAEGGSINDARKRMVLEGKVRFIRENSVPIESKGQSIEDLTVNETGMKDVPLEYYKKSILEAYDIATDKHNRRYGQDYAEGGDIGGWETNPNGTHYNLKKGGEIIWTDTSLNNYAPYKLWESYKNIHNQQSVGAFAHRDNKKYIGDYYLFMLDDYDRDFYSHLPLKPNEILFRTETETGKISKSNPLIKINVDKGWVYFMSDDNDPNSDEDDKNPKFNTRAVETLYLSLNSKIKSYNQGLIPYEEISSYAKGGSIKSSWFKGGLSFLNW